MADEEDDERGPREIAKQLVEFIGEENPPKRIEKDLDNALYTLSEGREWPDFVDSVSAEQAILCWRLVNKLIADPLPKKYVL